MKVEQIGRPYREPIQWRHVIKAVSQFFMPGIQYTGYEYPQHATVTPSLPQTITAILYITSAFPAARWFSEKNITCKSLLFYVLKFFFTHRLHCSQLMRANFNKLLGEKDALLLKTV
jgi:hypothetical protein